MTLKFAAYHPYLSYFGNGKNFINNDGCHIISIHLQPNMSDNGLALWRLGKKAFSAMPMFESIEKFDHEYKRYRNGIKVLEDVIKDYSPGNLVFKNEDEDEKIFNPNFGDMRSSQLLDTYFQLGMRNSKNCGHLAYPFLFSCLEEIDNTLCLLELDMRAGLVDAIIFAANSYANFHSINSGDDRLQQARSDLAMFGAIERYKRDPKQNEKSFILECWKVWQAKPDQYKSKANFARAMLDKCEHLTSQKKIEDWCRVWENAKTAAMPAQ